MKTSDFEQQFTAWLDGRLSPQDAADLEQEMRSRGFDPDAERQAAARTSTLLREHSKSPALAHSEFFNHQLLHRMDTEIGDKRKSKAPAGRSWLGVPWLALAGAASLLIAAVLFKTLIPVGGGIVADRSNYYATVVDARTFEKSVSASTVYNPRDNVTVLWLDGLDYLPADLVVQ